MNACPALSHRGAFNSIAWMFAALLFLCLATPQNARAGFISYDDFNDNSIDANHWRTSGNVNETNGRLELTYIANGNLSADADTFGKAGGQPIRGARWFQSAPDGTTAGEKEVWAEVTDGTNYIRVQNLVDVNDMIIKLNGVYGSGDGTRWNGSGGIIQIWENAGNIEILYNGILEQTLPSMPITPDSFFSLRASSSTGDVTGTRRLIVDDVSFVPVPEPSTYMLALMVLPSALLFRRRSKWSAATCRAQVADRVSTNE